MEYIGISNMRISIYSRTCPCGHLRKTDTSKMWTAYRSFFDFVCILICAATCELQNADTSRAPKVLFCTDLNLSNADTLCGVNLRFRAVLSGVPSRCHGQLCQSSNAYNKDRVPHTVTDRGPCVYRTNNYY